MDEIKQLIDVVKFDYQNSLGFIDGVVRVSIGIRTIAMAGCLALLAAALQTDQVVLAVFALLTSVAFGIQDAYHGWLYAEARSRAKKMEALLDGYYRQLQGGASEAGERQLLKNLRKHRIGLKPSLSGPVPPRSRARQAEWRGETNQVTRAAARLRLSWLVTSSRIIFGQARPRVVYWLLYPLLAAISAAVILVLLCSGPVDHQDRSLRVCIACKAAQ
jgi:hypothetical protein